MNTRFKVGDVVRYADKITSIYPELNGYMILTKLKDQTENPYSEPGWKFKYVDKSDNDTNWGVESIL